MHAACSENVESHILYFTCEKVMLIEKLQVTSSKWCFFKHV